MPKLNFDDAPQRINDERYIAESAVYAAALRRTIWVASNGSPGCYNDSTTVCTSKADAVATCLLIAGDDVPMGFRAALQRDGIVYVNGYVYRVEKMTLGDLF